MLAYIVEVILSWYLNVVIKGIKKSKTYVETFGSGKGLPK